MPSGGSGFLVVHGNGEGPVVAESIGKIDRVG